jgi:hypothetical protein
LPKEKRLEINAKNRLIINVKRLKENLPIQQLSSHLPVVGSHINLTCLKSDEMLFCKLSCCLIEIEDHERRASTAEEKRLERNARRAAYHRKKLEKESNNADNLSIEHPNVVPGKSYESCLLCC